MYLKKFILGGMIFLFVILSVFAYTPPNYNDIDLVLENEYTAPSYNDIDLVLGEISDTCSYSSGNWEVDCSDNCRITSNVNLGENNLTFTNSGKFKISANITNFDMIKIPDGCDLILKDNGGFK